MNAAGRPDLSEVCLTVTDTSVAAQAVARRIVADLPDVLRVESLLVRWVGATIATPAVAEVRIALADHRPARPDGGARRRRARPIACEAEVFLDGVIYLYG
ncbi:MAG: hypothetical protein Q8N10_14255 [Phenylobacterium sp.]|uniref:hypothetical protein n=1 Tax=Phenylobacterium sp. TaxID=1871053 RepID=UPI002728A79D|nr:hypothetical protein [Phenylobacterium sp.]MDO8912591.1 hypothetical protein [Phenylobacterium sp.]MDP3101648.1 hypothetical protein [Phenylobacterium sp.]